MACVGWVARVVAIVEAIIVHCASEWRLEGGHDPACVWVCQLWCLHVLAAVGRWGRRAREAWPPPNQAHVESAGRAYPHGQRGGGGVHSDSCSVVRRTGLRAGRRRGIPPRLAACAVHHTSREMGRSRAGPVRAPALWACAAQAVRSHCGPSATICLSVGRLLFQGVDTSCANYIHLDTITRGYPRRYAL